MPKVSGYNQKVDEKVISEQSQMAVDGMQSDITAPSPALLHILYRWMAGTSTGLISTIAAYWLL